MNQRTPVLLGGALAAALILMGVVMAENHDPVGIAPDAPRAGNAQVATFALG